MNSRFVRAILSIRLGALAIALLRSASIDAASFSEQWGLPGDIPVPGYYFASSRAAGSHVDLAVFRPIEGNWYIKSLTGVTRVEQWGLPGDIPVPGDLDSDGRADFIVWRPSDVVWYVLNSVTGAIRTQHWGEFGDIPMGNDYTFDGRMDFAVWRPSTGSWYVLDAVTGVSRTVDLGSAGDTPVARLHYPGWGFLVSVQHVSSEFESKQGQVDRLLGSVAQLKLYSRRRGGAVGDVPSAASFNCVYGEVANFDRPWTAGKAAGTWFLNNIPTFDQGQFGDIPVAADYLGVDPPWRARADFAVWRPSTGTWLVSENLTAC